MKIGFLGTWSEICGQACYLEHQVLSWRKAFPNDKIIIASEAGIAAKRQVDSSLLESDPPSGKFYSVECWNRNNADFEDARHLFDVNKVDIVNVSHEFGLFGFPDGEGYAYRISPDSDERFIYFVRGLQNAGIPVTVTLHTPALSGDISKYFAKLNANHYIVQGSPKDLEILINQHHVPPEKCSYIPHPIAAFHHPRETQEQLKKNLDLPDNTPVLLVTGFWRFEMNMRKILEAFKIVYDYMVRNHKTPPYLVFAGTVHPTDKAPVRDYIKQCMLYAYRQGLAKNIRFTNKFHTEQELDHYLAACDIVLNYREFVTNSTSVSAAALRAIAAKKPLVAWDNVGVANIPSTVCVKVRNEIDMGQHLIDMLTVYDKHPPDPLFVKLMQAENLFNQTYSWDAAVVKYRELFEKVIQEWQPSLTS